MTRLDEPERERKLPRLVAVGKLGATAEGLLRRSLRTAEGELDQVLWSWLDDEWRRDEAKRVAEELVWVH